ncbi:hypothetical protein FB451DRAFT_1247960 [Mycena latifolia]|nr:hypothetical protein FB451DRAFT_1247960 [Mycena latifolia]
MDSIFDDLLELSRPELYPDGIHHAAIKLILVQIASGHTAYLINGVSKWLLDDVILLIKGIMSVCIFCKYGFLDQRLTYAYISALPKGRHLLGPYISFMSELAQQNETVFEAVVLSKFLDMVLLSSSQQHSGAQNEFDEETTTSLSSAFSVLSTPPSEFWMTNLEQYWPFAHQPSLEEVVRHIDNTSPQDILASGVASSRALWHFMRCVALGGDVRGLMAEHLITQSHRSKVSMFSRIIYLLIPNTRESRSKEMKDLRVLIGGQKLLTNLLTKFLLELADSDAESRYALLDAVITVVIPLLIPEMDSTAIYKDLYRRGHFFPSIKRQPSYSKPTLRLFHIIRENMLVSVIHQPGSTASRLIAEVLQPLFNG